MNIEPICLIQIWDKPDASYWIKKCIHSVHKVLAKRSESNPIVIHKIIAPMEFVTLLNKENKELGLSQLEYTGSSELILNRMINEELRTKVSNMDAINKSDLYRIMYLNIFKDTRIRGIYLDTDIYLFKFPDFLCENEVSLMTEDDTFEFICNGAMSMRSKHSQFIEDYRDSMYQIIQSSNKMKFGDLGPRLASKVYKSLIGSDKCESSSHAKIIGHEELFKLSYYDYARRIWHGDFSDELARKLVGSTGTHLYKDRTKATAERIDEQLNLWVDILERNLSYIQNN